MCKTWAGNLVIIGFHGRFLISCFQPEWIYCRNSCLHSNSAVAFLIPNGTERIKGWERLGSCETLKGVISSSLGFACRFVSLKEGAGGKEVSMPRLQITLMIQMIFKHTNSEKQKTTCERFWTLSMLHSYYTCFLFFLEALLSIHFMLSFGN